MQRGPLLTCAPESNCSLSHLWERAGVRALRIAFQCRCHAQRRALTLTLSRARERGPHMRAWRNLFGSLFPLPQVGGSHSVHMGAADV
jgi:hypothetical protein